MVKCGYRVAMIVILSYAFTTNCQAYSGGTGEPNSPFQISTVADWQELTETPTDWDKHFGLTVDVDLENVSLFPVGNDANNFTGVLYGNNHTIRNIDINLPDTDNVGLFGCVGPNAQIVGLKVENITIKGKDSVGGLVGYCDGGNIAACYAGGSVRGKKCVGGLMGCGSDGILISSHSAASVTGSVFFVGGLVGTHGGIVSNCYSTGAVSGGGGVGGLVGAADFVSCCYSTGSVNGSGAGGLVGIGRGGYACMSFWDVNTSGCETSYGGIGKTTAEMQQINTFLNAGWDFLGETASGVCDFWHMPDSPGYPVLSALNGYSPAELPGSGIEAAPYIVTDANGLGAVWYRASAHYLLANHIDLAGISWSGAIIPSFSGVFEGNDHVISRMDVNAPGSNYVGLVGRLFGSGRIENLRTEDISIVGRIYVGGLAGRNDGAISNCSAAGSVSGNSWVGGLAGHNYYGTVSNCRSAGSVSGGGWIGGVVGLNDDGAIVNCYSTSSVIGTSSIGGLVGRSNSSGIISNCFATGSIRGDSKVGGLVGINHHAMIVNCCSTGAVNGDGNNVGGLVGSDGYGSLKNCYSTGAVSGNDNVGGLVGNSWFGAIVNCYSAGPVEGINNVGGLLGNGDRSTTSRSFWDVNSSGYTTSAGGTGKYTEQMQDIGTFLEAGWDFVAETANGTCDNWQMPDAPGYPIVSTLNGYIPGEPPGSGTETAPYMISDANELGTVWYRFSAHYMLANDIDLAGVKWGVPIVPFFSGVLDGNDHAVRNAEINMPGGNFAAIFGYMPESGRLKNVSVEDVSIVGDDYVGGLAGRSDGAVSNCYVSGSIQGDAHVGGLMGYSSGDSISNCGSVGSVGGYASVGGLVGTVLYSAISDCTWAGSVSGYSSVGGLLGNYHCGTINCGTIWSCRSSGLVSGDYYIGGLVGMCSDGPIINCSSSCAVEGDDYAVGGLVGRNYSLVMASYASGSVSGEDCVGGLVGHNKNGVIADSYSVGAVSGVDRIGGLVGYNEEAEIMHSYSTGSVGGIGRVGGFVGSWHSSIINGYFLRPDDGGGPDNGPGNALSDTEMRKQASFIYWDFAGEAANGEEDIWAICEGMNYPRLSWQILPQADRRCPDGVGFEDFREFGSLWGTNDGGVYLDDEEGVGFGDLMVFCEQWLEGR